MDGKGGSQDSWLLCRAGPHLCALPLGPVQEVMRMLPVDALADAPAFVSGIAVVRGVPVPVLDLGRLLGDGTAPTRLVTVRVGGRILGLALAEVVGVRRQDDVGARTPVPLLRDAARESVSAIGVLDSEALLFLEGLRLLAKDVPI